jgi:hypothetical protein
MSTALASARANAEHGTVVAAHTPGYDGDHDLGVAYTVTAHDGDLCQRCDHVAATPEVLHQHMLDSHLEDDHR